MENYSHQSFPDSGNSSPLSREIDSENIPSWGDPSAAAVSNFKVKFMCSYGGKIQPRSHDSQLSYVGGDTKILSVDRNTKFSAVIAKLSSLCDAPSASDICFKYQLPGEDLDALISVTNDEDLEQMMLEYDRLNRSSPKPARLRIFLFSVNSNPNPEEYQFKEQAKPEGSWFVDALNSVQHRLLDDSSPPSAPNSEPSNPDFLFGFDKSRNDPNHNDASNLNDHFAVREPVPSIQSQMDRFRIGEVESQKSHEEAVVNPDSNVSGVYQGEYYNVQDKVSPVPSQALPMPMSAGYWPERQVIAGNYPIASGILADQQPVYVIQTPGGGACHPNPSLRTMTGSPTGTGQTYYNIPRTMPQTYREHPAYNAIPSAPDKRIQQSNGSSTGYNDGSGYTQVSYVDSSGRPVYYTLAGGGLTPQPYQVPTVSGKVVGGLTPQPYQVPTVSGTVVDGRAVSGVDMGIIGGKAV